MQWDASPEMMKAMTEIEAVLNLTKVTTTLCQYEQLYTGAYKALIKGLTMKGLREESIQVIDLSATDTRRELPRKRVPVSELSPLGQETRERALLEGERRFCGNNTEAIQGLPVKLSKREKLATLLDLRTVGAAHLSKEEAAEALQTLESEYASFAMVAESYKSKTEAEQMASSHCASTISDKGSTSAASAFKLTSGFTYGESQWSDEDATDESMPSEQFREEAHRCFKVWRRHQIGWVKEFPEENLSHPLDMSDLMALDIGPMYRKLEQEKVYGYLPLMAGCSTGQIGALNAESFCERTLSCASNVLTEGNTLLGDEELEMLVVLRMNRRFMEFMRQNYPQLVEDLVAKHRGREMFRETDDDVCVLDD